MIKTISKSDFERALPIGTSAQNNVYEMVLPEVESQFDLLNEQILGSAGCDMFDEAAEDSVLRRNYIRMVVVTAFLSVMRQLDLVLTPTGFGVVANDNVSPASKQRVDALESQLRNTLFVSQALVFNELRSKSWGDTSQAVSNIQTLYDEYEYLRRKGTSVDAGEWVKIQQPLRDADIFLRKKVSDEQMDAFMKLYRENDKDGLDIRSVVIMHIKNFYSEWCFVSPGHATGYLLRKIISSMEKPSEVEYYKEYLSSDAYKTNHHENFSNTKESSAFMFNG